MSVRVQPARQLDAWRHKSISVWSAATQADDWRCCWRWRRAIGEGFQRCLLHLRKKGQELSAHKVLKVSHIYIRFRVQRLPWIVYVFPELVTPYVNIRQFWPSMKSLTVPRVVKLKKSFWVVSSAKARVNVNLWWAFDVPRILFLNVCESSGACAIKQCLLTISTQPYNIIKVNLHIQLGCHRYALICIIHTWSSPFFFSWANNGRTRK